MNRGEIWLAAVGRKARPDDVLTRQQVIDVRGLVTVAEVTTSIRGTGAEVDFDHDRAGLERHSVVNCDGLHTVAKASLVDRAGSLDDATMRRVCAAIGYALDC